MNIIVLQDDTGIVGVVGPFECTVDGEARRNREWDRLKQYATEKGLRLGGCWVMHRSVAGLIATLSEDPEAHEGPGEG